jgi:hypothetical protein
MSSLVTPNRPTNTTMCPGAPSKPRPANLDLSGLAPRRLIFAAQPQCSPNRILTEEEMKLERNAFADPVGYSLAKAVSKNKKV